MKHDQTATEVVPTAQVTRAIDECRQLLLDIDAHRISMEQHGWMKGQTRLVEAEKKRNRLKERTNELLAALEKAGDNPAMVTLKPQAEAFIKAGRTLNRFLTACQKLDQGNRIETIFWLVDYNQED